MTAPTAGGVAPEAREAAKRLAYADPPYLGCCHLYGHDHGDDGLCWDEPSTHALLFHRLRSFDGWAYSCTAPSLTDLLPLVPPPYRVAAWVKPFAAFKRNVRIAYTWEPVIFRPGRDSSKDGAPVGRDHLAEPITMRRGFTGAKPARFNRWVLDLLGYVEGDDVTDLYPGTGGMASTLREAVLL
jgi:hypothetical protein